MPQGRFGGGSICHFCWFHFFPAHSHLDWCPAKSCSVRGIKEVVLSQRTYIISEKLRRTAYEKQNHRQRFLYLTWPVSSPLWILNWSFTVWTELTFQLLCTLVTMAVLCPCLVWLGFVHAILGIKCFLHHVGWNNRTMSLASVRLKIQCLYTIMYTIMLKVSVWNWVRKSFFAVWVTYPSYPKSACLLIGLSLF